MIKAERISALFEEAAFDSERMPEACDRAAELLGANSMYLLRMVNSQPDFVHGSSAQSFFESYMKEEWWRLDEMTQTARDRRLTGFQLEQNVVPSDVRRQSQFVHEFRRKHDAAWIGGWGFVLDGEHWAFAALRGERQGPFLPEDEHAFARMATPIVRSAQLAGRIRLVWAKGLAEGLGCTGEAAVVLDHRGLCAFATSAAEALFDECFGVRQGRLWAVDRRASQSIGRLIDYAMQRDPEQPPDAAIVPRIGKRPIAVVPLRVRGRGLDALPGARVILLLVDPDRRPRPKHALLCDLYRLTPTEAEVAALLGRGESVEQIAAQMAVAVATVRHHLKRLFEKTETRRQAELVALIARLPGG